VPAPSYSAPPPEPVAVPPRPSSIGAPPALSFNGQLADKLVDLGLTQEQITGVLLLSREVVEKVVWEVVPVLAESLIKEELKRLTGE
nr:response regulator [Myxococcota bacterium]